MPSYARAILTGAAVTFGVVALMCGLELLGLGGGPVDLVILLSFLSAGLFAVLVVPCCLIALCRSHWRKPGLLTLLGLASACLCFPIFYPVRWGFRHLAFHLLARRSRPIVAAIRDYEQRHSTSPPNLSALVPEFLPEVPGTGMWSYPDYVYWAGRAPGKDQSEPYWVLKVECPDGILSWDEYMYVSKWSHSGADFDPERSHFDWYYSSP